VRLSGTQIEALQASTVQTVEDVRLAVRVGVWDGELEKTAFWTPDFITDFENSVLYGVLER
jgi:hypothetical protein